MKKLLTVGRSTADPRSFHTFSTRGMGTVVPRALDDGSDRTLTSDSGMTYRLFRSKKVPGTFAGKCQAPFWACAAVLLMVAGSPLPADAADSILYRLFLRDGTSITSYGEFARVAD